MKDGGGTAFPQIAFEDGAGGTLSNNMGMSLRDWFAGEAQDECPINQYEHEACAEWCYARADAMIKEREK